MRAPSFSTIALKENFGLVLTMRNVLQARLRGYLRRWHSRAIIKNEFTAGEVFGMELRFLRLAERKEKREYGVRRFRFVMLLLEGKKRGRAFERWRRNVA